MTHINQPGNVNPLVSEPNRATAPIRPDAEPAAAPGRFAAHLAEPLAKKMTGKSDPDTTPEPLKGRPRSFADASASSPSPRANTNPMPRPRGDANAPIPRSPTNDNPRPAAGRILNDTPLRPAVEPANSATPRPLRTAARDNDAPTNDFNPRSSRPNATSDANPRSGGNNSGPNDNPSSPRPGLTRPTDVAAAPIDSTQTPGLPITAGSIPGQDIPTSPIFATATLADVTLNGLLPQVPSAPNAEDWKQKMQMLLMGGNTDLFMQQSPALALLAGRLEYLDPQQIPAVVAQSPLLQGILSTAKTADALQTAMPLEQNLKILGLVPANIPSEALGLEPLAQQPTVKIADTLKALGFDVQRAVQEGDLLKNNLGLDGLQGYMERADRLRAALGITPMPINPLALNLQALQGNPNPQPIAAAAMNINPADAALGAKLPRLAPQTTLPLSMVQLWTKVPDQDELTAITLDADHLLPTFEAPTNDLNAFDPFAASDALNNPSPLTAPTMDQVPLVMNTLPRAQVAVQDPFLAMAQRWDPASLQTLRPEDFATQNFTEVDPGALQQQPVRSLDDLLHRHLVQPTEFHSRMEAAPTTSRDNVPFDIQSLAISIQDLSNPGDNSSNASADQNNNPSFLNQDANPFLTSGPTQAFGAKETFTLQGPAPQTAQQPVSPQHMQDILDKSSMLIKDGGGSIRVDLGSREMGPLDLALDINGKNVELRIVTHSNQAREALVQELPRLRESLHNQHLNLDKVEIGLSYNSSAFSQQPGNRQGREQFFENVSESSSRGPGGIRGTTRSYRQSIAVGPEPRVPLHNGLIQVRV